jgi:hypothetical protein
MKKIRELAGDGGGGGEGEGSRGIAKLARRDKTDAAAE